jgi:cell division protein FtsL
MAAPTRAAVFGLASLWMAVLISAYGLVWTTHDSRQKINRLELMRHAAADLQVEWGQYLLEQSAWAAYSRIEGVAVQQLGMVIPDSQKIILVKE